MICPSNVTIPCSIGDEVYAISRVGGRLRVRWGKVSEMYFIEGMRLCIVVKNICRGEWGKKIFPTFEEADNYLRGVTREDEIL